MKLISNNIAPLPFYDSIEQQNHRKDYAFGQIYPLITYRNMLLPFQFAIPTEYTITNARLYNVKTEEVTTIWGELSENGLQLIKGVGCNIVMYNATLPVNSIKYEGQYYLSISLYNTITKASSLVYSDIFTVVNNVSDYLLLEYKNTSAFNIKDGKIDFSNNFIFKCYLNTQIGKPEYVFEEEATDRLGYSFIETQISKKVYKFTFLAPEYLCDALRIVRLCNYKRITSKGQTYDVSNFSITPEWQEQGDLAAVECEFETDTVIANLGGYADTDSLSGKSFNNDFNEDFNSEY